MNEKNEDDFWFEDDDDAEATRDPASEAGGSAPDGMTALGGSAGANAARKVLEMLGMPSEMVDGAEQEYEEKTAEQKSKGAEIRDKGIALAKEKTTEELSEEYIVTLAARLYKAHCEDCLRQLITGMVATIKSVPVNTIIKEKQKHEISEK
jgi:hypothetical protein